METDFTYNQAVFGLMLLGAKADGKLQDEEKKLLVELTSEEHHLSADEYKYVINAAKEKSDYDFRSAVYSTLNSFPEEERVKAMYWLLQLIRSDRSSDNSMDQSNNSEEMEVFGRALDNLKIDKKQVEDYEKSRED